MDSTQPTACRFLPSKVLAAYNRSHKSHEKNKAHFPQRYDRFGHADAGPLSKSQQPAPQQAASRFDVTHYRIEAQIIPDQHMLRAGADVTFMPLDATRSVVFELNGSLKVESIEKDGKALTGVRSGCGRSRRSRTERAHRSGPGCSGKSTRYAANSLERRADQSGRRAAGDEAIGLRRHRRFLPDVCLALVSFS